MMDIAFDFGLFLNLMVMLFLMELARRTAQAAKVWLVKLN